MSGRIAIGDLNDLLDVELPDDDWETLGGLIFNTLEHVPVAGESVSNQGFLFTVTEMEGRRIKLVRVEPAPPGSFTDPADVTPEALRAALTEHGGVQEKVWRGLGLQSRDG